MILSFFEATVDTLLDVGAVALLNGGITALVHNRCSLYLKNH